MPIHPISSHLSLKSPELLRPSLMEEEGRGGNKAPVGKGSTPDAKAPLPNRVNLVLV